jgi:hypothetical protein
MEIIAHARKRAAEGSSEGERDAGRVGNGGRRTRRAERSLTAAWIDASVMVCDTYFGACCCLLKYTRADAITIGRKYLQIRQLAII